MRTQAELAELLKSNKLLLDTPNVGAGGSAVVHKARTQGDNVFSKPSGTEVAVKEYNEMLFKDERQKKRVDLEASVGTRINHENVMGIYGLVLDAANSRPPLLIVQWVEGTPADKWIRAAERPIKWDGLKKILEGLVSGLQAIHTAQLKHRDIKPENIFIRADGTPVIMDFGIAELDTDSETTMHTPVKDFIGTLRYASPQFIRGEEFDTADDVYSLGATLYELVTGNRPFDSVERKSLLPVHVLEGTLSIAAVPDGLPPQLRVLIGGCVAKDRKRRPSLEDLATFAKDPEHSPYIQRELDARNRDERGFEIIEVSGGGKNLYADLRGLTPKGTRFKIVRRGTKKIRVPSLGGEVIPERYIGEASLKHFHQGVGHFAVHGRKWVPPSSNFSMLIGQTPGYWEETEGATEPPAAGDLLVPDED